jgi:hypothetical protein
LHFNDVVRREIAKKIWKHQKVGKKYEKIKVK